MTAGLVIVQSAASGVDLACGVLLLHAVSMHVTALLPHDAVLHVFHAVSRLWAHSMQQAHSKPHQQSPLNLNIRHTDKGNILSNTLHHLLEGTTVHHAPFTCKCTMPTQI
jgi:hypothetical protein